MIKSLTLVLIAFCLFSCGNKGESEAQNTDRKVSGGLCAPTLTGAYLTDNPAPVFTGYGYFDYPVTTESRAAQKYFTQGWGLAAGFNHAEAARSFYWATQEDPKCAMCYWGLAYALGPNYNAGMDPEVVDDAIAAIQQAQLLSGNCTEKERDLIAAMAERYPTKIVEDRADYDIAYSKAMERLWKKYPEDHNIAVMYAESIMDLHPWDLWSKDGTSQPWTPEILAVLESVRSEDPNHVIANHLYIHAVEASHRPADGIDAAENLGGSVPGAGHLVHMPAHIYIRTGNYHKCTEMNVQAVEVDSVYVSACHAAGVYPLAYYPHNFHFMCACAAIEGDADLAIEASYRMQEKLDTSTMREDGWGTVQHYYTIPYYILVKFAQWDDILDIPMPAEDLKYPRAVLHYARGMAYAGKGRTGSATQELASLRALTRDEDVEKINIWEINEASELLEIAQRVLEADIHTASGALEKAVPLLAEAVAIEDGLNYNEPPDWFFSVRHHLGDVLLKLQRWAEAEEVYRTDLFHFPENGWALNGLREALLGQSKTSEAQEVKKRLDIAWQHADVRLKGSRVL